MKYHEDDTYSAGVAGTAWSDNFTINSIYDPYTAIGGHQPYGRDEMAELYNRYVVTKCKWVFYAAVNTANNELCTFGARVAKGGAGGEPAALGVTNMYPYTEQTYVKSGCLSLANGVKRFSGIVDIAKVWGVRKQTLLDDDTFSATQSTEPSKEVWLQLMCNVTNLAASLGLNYHLELTFYGYFFQRIVLPTS